MYYFLLRSVPLKWSLRRAHSRVRQLEQRLHSEYWKNRAYALREIKLAADLRKRAEAEFANTPEDSEARDRLTHQVHVAREYEEAMRSYLEGVEERREDFRQIQAGYEQENSGGSGLSPIRSKG
jgi:thioredoxin-like negative regulator of GroEL